MKLKMKLRNMGVKVRSGESTAKQLLPKERTEYPTLRLHSGNIKGLNDITRGSKCLLIFEAEVIGIRMPDDWDRTHWNLKESDTIAEFKLLKGELQPIGQSEK